MSRGDTTESSVYIPNAKSLPQKPIQPDPQLAPLDERLDQVTRIIPKQPYLLAIPSGRQFHPSEHQIKEECREHETGFKPEERDLQYLSFLRPGWDRTIFKLLKPDTPKSSASRQMASAGAVPKTAARKISIADYKKRSSLPATGANGTPVADSSRSRASSSNLASNLPLSGIKRNLEEPDKYKAIPNGNDEPPAKKLKSSPGLEMDRSKSSKPKSKIALPPPLSPTLPAFVERLLAKSVETPAKTQTSEPGSTHKTDRLSSQPNHSKSSSQDETRNRKHDKSSKSSLQATRPLTNGAHQSAFELSAKSSRLTAPDADAIKVEPMPRQRSEPKPSVVVTLKIPRYMRKDMDRLLRLPPPKRLKEPTPAPKSTTNSTAEKGFHSKSGAKRPREDDSLEVHREAKRSKSPIQQDRAGTKKPRETTPVIKDEVTTPQAVAGFGTPVPPPSASRSGRDKQTPSESGSANSYTNERFEGLAKIRRTYSDLGVVLKKEGDKLSSPDMNSAQKRKFIASRIETTLAFMLSYTIGDEVFRLRRRPPEPDATWGTLLSWLRSVHDLVQDHPPLSGLLLQLEAISRMVIWRQRSDIIEQGESPITIEQYKELRGLCEEAHRKFIKGSARLSVDHLQDDFPRTWKAKAKVPLAHTNYKMTKDNLNGEFYLPLTSTSLPIEGVRAGQTLLKEWCRLEGVDWVPKLDL